MKWTKHLIAMGWVATVATRAADAPAAPAATAAPKGTQAPVTLDNWMSYMQSPVAPSRSRAYKGDDANTPFLPPEPNDATSTPVSISAKPVDGGVAITSVGGDAAAGKPTHDDDKLAALAIADRDFFATLAQNPAAWPADERDRRAQKIHDDYWKYIAQYPGDVNAIVLYGKLLNRTGQRDAAYTTFLYADTLDPHLAVVKQALGNHLAEDGSYAAALALLREAVKIDPNQAVYHYEIGMLLDVYYESFLNDKSFDKATLNQTMEAEFAAAAKLKPDAVPLAWRHAECYYDMIDPDWNAALAAWGELARTTTDPLEGEVIRLHRARVLTELQRLEEARALLNQPVRPELEATRAALLKRLAKAATPAAPAATAASGQPAP